MKYFLTLLSFVLLSNKIIGQTSIDFVDNNYEMAKQKAKESGKILFIMIYDPECSHCNYMKKEVLTDANVIAFYNQNFVNLMIDGTQPYGRQFSLKYNVPALPAFLYLDANEKIVYSAIGVMKAEEMISDAKQYALNPPMNVSTLEAQFKADTTNAQTCYYYLNAIKRGVDKDKLEGITKKYLASQSDKDLISVVNWKIMALGVNDLHAKEFQFILNHQNELAAIASTKRVQTKILSVINKTLKQDAEKIDTMAFARDKGFIKQNKISFADTAIFKNELTLFEYAKNWTKYKQITQATTEKLVWNELKTLNEIAVNYAQHFSSVNDLKWAIRWAERANQLKESYNSDYLVAKLYQRIKDLNQAKVYALKAKKFGIETGKSQEEIDKLSKEFNLQ